MGTSLPWNTGWTRLLLFIKLVTPFALPGGRVEVGMVVSRVYTGNCMVVQDVTLS